MLKIEIPFSEGWDENAQEFVTFKGQTLVLEHSLVSLSKWESKWHKPFLDNKKMTVEELIDYVRCMTITQNVDPQAYNFLTTDNFKRINEYINDSMTATFFRDEKSKPNREIITSELIYYWMISLGVPFECQKWHLNRLLTLIRVCEIKNSASVKKTPKSKLISRNAELNAARRKAWNTRG